MIEFFDIIERKLVHWLNEGKFRYNEVNDGGSNGDWKECVPSSVDLLFKYGVFLEVFFNLF